MVNFNYLLKKLKSSNIFMLIGNGSKNQFRYIEDLKKILKKILKTIPKNSNFLYFGDGINKKNQI